MPSHLYSLVIQSSHKVIRKYVVIVYSRRLLTDAKLLQLVCQCQGQSYNEFIALRIRNEKMIYAVVSLQDLVKLTTGTYVYCNLHVM